MSDHLAGEWAMDWTDECCTAQPTVLVADPDRAVRDFLKAALEEIGLDVLEAGNATDVRKRLHQQRPSLVFAEVMLPHATGDKLAAEIIRRGIPVVLMSAHPEGLRRAQEARRVVLSKPLQIKDVLRAAIVTLPSWGPHV